MMHVKHLAHCLAQSQCSLNKMLTKHTSHLDLRMCRICYILTWSALLVSTSSFIQNIYHMETVVLDIMWETDVYAMIPSLKKFTISKG